jgi:2-polyprenyl-6-methoxyphenol hydroxylase-like FAD-dependent oxidoreductase
LRIAVIGGGPGGLYFAYLWKRRHPDAHIDLFEQNPEGATWGFGVVFSEQALDFLRADDAETVDAITPRMESWKKSRSTCAAGVKSMASILLDRPAELLTILQQRACDRRHPRYDTTIDALPTPRLRPDRRGRRIELAGAPPF